MKRTKLLSLGFAAFLSLGFTTQATHVKASEAIEPKDITQAADQIYVSKLVPITTQQSIWVTEVKGGKTIPVIYITVGPLRIGDIHVLQGIYQRARMHQMPTPPIASEPLSWKDSTIAIVFQYEMDCTSMNCYSQFLLERVQLCG